MEIVGLFKGLKLNNYYKFLLYLSGIVFIISLIFDVKDIENSRLRFISMWVMIASCGIWIVDNYIEQLADYLYERFRNELKATRKNYINSCYLLVTIEAG